MLKKFISSFLCVSILLTGNVFTTHADDKNLDEKLEQTYSIGELNGYLAGNAHNVKQLYTNQKITPTITGHGFAAERGNNLIDTLKGTNATVVGDNNIKNGPDRMIINRNGSITWIQDKYYSTASKSVNAAFDDATGIYRYINADGSPMKLEVPSDQYDEAVKLMREKIQNGSVANLTDPDEAVNVVKKGGLSYKQAVNLAKAGTVESLTYDSVNGIVSAGYAAGIGFAIDYACCILNGVDSKTALKNAGFNGLKTGGVVFATYVISSQLAKTGLTNALVPTSEAIAKALGKNVCEAILLKTGVDTAGMSTATITANTAKILSKELIADGVLIVVLTGKDVTDLFRGRISKEEMLKNLSVSIIGVAIGTVGSYGGAVVGTWVAPGAGTVIGKVVGGILAGSLSSFAAEKIIGQFYESDAEEMYNVIYDEFLILCDEYLVSEDEAKALTKSLSSKLSGDTLKDMYASDDRSKFAKDILDPLFVEMAKKRTKITIPSEEELRMEMKNSLQGVVFIH